MGDFEEALKRAKEEEKEFSAAKKAEAVPGKDIFSGEVELTHHDPRLLMTNAFRTLRTNLKISSSPKPSLKVLVTSALAGEGRTTVAVNLGIIATFNEVRNSLVVDCDLYHPDVHRIFGRTREPGLTDVISGECRLEEAIQQTRYGYLSILPSGKLPIDPPAVLESEEMHTLLAGLADRYDLVVLDSPPVSNFSDALILGTLVDGVIMVIRAGSTNREVAQKAKDALLGARAKVLGVALNQTWSPTDWQSWNLSSFQGSAVEQIRRAIRRWGDWREGKP